MATANGKPGGKPEEPQDPKTRSDSEFPEVTSNFSIGIERFRLSERLSDLDLSGGEGEPSGINGDGRVRYVLKGELGRGGMGAVYRVLDRDLHRTLAMKVAGAGTGSGSSADGTSLSSNMLTRFLEEAQVTGQLDHPGIVPLHELGVDPEGRVYFTMRLVKGDHLGQVIRKVHDGSGEWTLDGVLPLFMKICEAVGYAHAKGVVHRDLKPANIMTGRFGEVYVMDWGLAKVRGREDRRDLRPDPDAEVSQTIIRTDRSDDGDGALATMDGTVFGTPAYMSPEQARGIISRVDERSDVYSLCAMLYHLLTGQPPYVPEGSRLSGHTVHKWVLEGPPQPLSELAPDAPADLVAVVEKGMARNPEARYDSMLDVALDLRNFLRGRPVTANPLGVHTRVARWCRSNPVVAGFLMALTLATLVGSWALSDLTTSLVRSAALEGAALKTTMLEDVNTLYNADVVQRVKDVVDVRYDYEDEDHAIPLPATFLTKLAEAISEQDTGMEVRHYSNWPFTFRDEDYGGPRDEFEREALARLDANPDVPYYRFEEIEGRPWLRYAASRRMRAGCVGCHNEHAFSPKRDWEEGDVRGVLQITRPLDEDVERTHAGLVTRFTLVGGLGIGLALVSAFLLVRQSRQRRA